MQHPLLAAVAMYAKDFPELEAVVTVEKNGDYKKYSYAQLLQRSSLEAAGLAKLGLTQGQRVLLLVTPGFEFLSLTLAVIACGGVPMFLDPGMGLPNIKRCIADCKPTGFIGSGKAQILRLLARKEFQSVSWFVTTANIPLPATMTLAALVKSPRQRNATLETPSFGATDPALIAFTSGATGTPKGVIFTPTTLQAQLSIFKSIFGPTTGTRDLPLLPIFAVYNAALGTSSVFGVTHPTKPLQFNPDQVIKVLQELSVASSFGSPTLWEKIADAALAKGATFPALKRLCMAGVGVPERMLKKTKQIFPNAAILTPYGSTESLPVTSLESAERLDGEAQVASNESGYGTLVGKPLIDVRIVRVADTIDTSAILPNGIIGEIIVSGENVSTSYLNRPEATKAAKSIDPDRRLWHRMGDVGYFDNHGRLYYCGRKMHAVSAVNGTFYSECVENVFNQHSGIRRSALTYFSKSNEAGIAVEIAADAPQSAIRNELRALAETHPWTAGLKRFEFHTSFPVDARHNAKIFRERLGD